MAITLTPAEWTMLARRHWKELYPIVHSHAQAELDRLDPDVTIDMNEVVERLFPVSLAVGEGITARQRLYSALKAAVKNDLMQGYHSPGPGRRYMGRAINPHVWHKLRPELVKAPTIKTKTVECPCCGTKFEVAD